jgi:hypothetical protein
LTTPLCCKSTRNISLGCCHCRSSSASGYWAEIGRSGRPPGPYFKREWCVVDEVPAELDVVRYWDLAATEKTEFNDPDWTVGIKLGRNRNGGYWLLDMVRRRANPGDVEKLLLNIASQDGTRVRIGFSQDPGQAGKSQALHLVRALSGFSVTPSPESGDKVRGSGRSVRSAVQATPRTMSQRMMTILKQSYCATGVSLSVSNLISSRA